jgi:hypothetical protein
MIGFWAAAIVVASATGVNVPDSFEIEGRVLGRGVMCMQFLLSTGERISLEGVAPLKLRQGAELRLTGTWMSRSLCMEGRSFRMQDWVELN